MKREDMTYPRGRIGSEPKGDPAGFEDSLRCSLLVVFVSEEMGLRSMFENRANTGGRGGGKGSAGLKRVSSRKKQNGPEPGLSFDPCT